MVSPRRPQVEPIKCALLHVGLHKCGSTFLQKQVFAENQAVRLLRDHEHRRQYSLIQRGDIGYDRTAFARAFWEQADNRKVVVSSEALSGNAFNSQSAIHIAHELTEIFDPENVLVVVRNPLDYIFSAWSNHVRLGGSLSLYRFMYHQASPGRFKDTPALFEKLNYTAYLEVLSACFGHERLKVMLLEDLKRDQSAFLKDLSDMIGVSLSARDSVARPQASLSLTGNRVARVFNLLFNSTLNGGPLAVLPGQKSWRATLERVFEDPSGSGEKRRSYVRRHLRPVDLDRLGQYVEALEAYLQRDLTVLDYPKRRH